MANKDAAEKIFWELVEDYADWANDCSLGMQALAITRITTHVLKATTRACRSDWEGAASACCDMTRTALGLLTHAEFSAAKNIIWDMAMAAHIASGKHGEMFPEVQRAVLKDLGTSITDVLGHPAVA
ncbi:MAG TPA: hypothetical protein VJP84_11615 [Steroidobacteraceae bacterium]|jgi:hypothetical protein|nr:hypothetical protein [Steroidobacteraceae bacterium]